MRILNLIIVYRQDKRAILMCKRRKPPYAGRFNLVGGKAAESEDGLTAAYRELEEETTLSKADIVLEHFMDLAYHVFGYTLQVYAGCLTADKAVHGEENELFWIDIGEDFFGNPFAGDGNLGHILRLANAHYIDFGKR